MYDASYRSSFWREREKKTRIKREKEDQQGEEEKKRYTFALF